MATESEIFKEIQEYVTRHVPGLYTLPYSEHFNYLFTKYAGSLGINANRDKDKEKFWFLLRAYCRQWSEPERKAV